MATAIPFKCTCGKIFHFYLPKIKLYELVSMTSQDKIMEAKEADIEEEQNGEIELVKRTAKMIDAEYVDLREKEIITCSVCGTEINVMAILKTSTEKESTKSP